MSGFGILYAVSDSVRNVLIDAKSKSEWYAVLADYRVETAPTFDTDQSLQAALLAFAAASEPLSQMTTGEFRTEDDGFGDPNVVFFGRSQVAELSAILALQTDEEFATLVQVTGNDPAHKWLLKPLQAFFLEAASEGLAIAMLWGR